ncbi:MAG: CheY-P phosphatase CheX [Syntrophorhabdus sp. PtaU1.Bin002]|nr:MAG: CheY-P phosphatase CheX [Syntrophorhabdus sp. PtaB.Bin006]OPY70813.1 MAG: CheY-P phosphatase CheX [Syntrophorhabdus sp. PtaU1.Bin002]OPY75074.1 MAG: CheY-P phosphatase CheX [Syntrophorhabdus sp. PtaU1.Bin050]
MDVKYINPFIAAAQTVFKSMLAIDAKMGKPIIKNKGVASGDVTGIMGLVGDRKGTLCISFHERGALFVFKTLVGDECDKLCPEVVDAIGELTNIISGQARKEFEQAGVNLSAAIPMVVVGKNTEMNFITAIPIISLPFSFSVNNGDHETMYLDFSFE